MKRHLREVNETYFEHMKFASKCGMKMVLAGIACILHSLLPNLFASTASDTMKTLDEEINQRKEKGPI